MTHADKRRFAEQVLDRTSLHLHLDPRRPGVVLPGHLREAPSVTLQVGRTGMYVPIPDLVVDDDGVRATLSFSRRPFACTIPWSAVYALVADTGESLAFDGEAPPDLAPPHHEQCSLCLAPRESVGHLVAADDVSICDRCVNLHRRRSRWERLVAWLRRRPAARGVIVALPYRAAPDERCSFCRATSTDLVRGVHARICRPCIQLSHEVLRAL